MVVFELRASPQTRVSCVCGSKSYTASIRKVSFFNVLLNILFSQKIRGTCRVHLIEYMCKNLSQIGLEMSKIFDPDERGVQLMKIVDNRENHRRRSAAMVLLYE